MHAEELSQDEKRALYRDGFIVLKDVVPTELTFAAKRRINIFAGCEGALFKYYQELASSHEFPDLINRSPLRSIMQSAMGPFDAPQRAMPMVLYPRDPSPEIGGYGVADKDIPNFGFAPHLDGQWAGALPRNQNEVDDWQSPRTEHFGSGDARARGRNNTPFFQDPACRLSLGSFTAFVGVCLNDQTAFGRGNLAVLRGAHHAVEDFFKMQRDSGGVVGPEGAGWPRLKPVGDGHVAINHLPDAIRNLFKDGAQFTPDGSMWPQPTPILMDEGDAVVTLHAIPHCGTRNELGAEPRMNVYFRLRRERPGGARVLGDSDHPDRGWNGEFLDYPGDHDPWQVAIDKLCDHWSEWDGMGDIVAESAS